MQGRGGECEGLVGMAASGKEWSVEETMEKLCLDCNYTRIYAFQWHCAGIHHSWYVLSRQLPFISQQILKVTCRAKVYLMKFHVLVISLIFQLP